MGLLEEIRSRRLRFGEEEVACRVTATWAMNGRSRIDPFRQGDRPAEPYAYAIVSTTRGLGVCYADRHLVPPEDWTGMDARAIRAQGTEWDVALLDAIGSRNPVQPLRTEEIEGLAHEKARWRARIVADAVLGVFRGTGGSPVVFNFGAVGAILDELAARRCEVHACDLHPVVVGQAAGGTMVVCFAELEPLIRPGSVLLVTGMAIANGTMDEVLALGRSRQASVVIYAETGSSFATEYLAAGAKAVVAESFPFYTMAGKSQIRVYVAP